MEPTLERMIGRAWTRIYQEEIDKRPIEIFVIFYPSFGFVVKVYPNITEKYKRLANQLRGKL